MQQRTPVEQLPGGSRAPWLDLDARLALGPLQVRTFWNDAQTRALPRQVREQRRKKLLLRLLCGFLAACSLLYTLLCWRG